MAFDQPIEWILGTLLILASLGVIGAKKPVYAGLSFLWALILLSALYLQLSAEFIAVMQVLVYAGAILVIFMFVMILFQDAHQQMALVKAESARPLILTSALFFTLGWFWMGREFLGLSPATGTLPEGFGTVQSLGRALFVDFFFPFEAVTLLFLIAVVGAVYIGKKEG